MSQEQVYKTLKKNPKGLTVKQIAKKTKKSTGSTTSSLKKMLKYNEVTYTLIEQIKNKKPARKYKLK